MFRLFIIRPNANFLLSRIFLRELENYIDCPELVGRCFLERVCVFF